MIAAVTAERSRHRSHFLIGRICAASCGTWAPPAAHVVGASYGGLIAIDTALESPELVTALVLVAPSVSGHRGPPRSIVAGVEAAEARGDLAGAVELELQLWVDGPRRRPDQVNSDVREKVRIMNTLAFEKASEAGADQSSDRPAIARLADVRAPVLLVAGDQELADRVTLVEDLARQFYGARKAMIPGGAHMVTMEQPESFTRVALEFLVNAPSTRT
ncbi:MAG: alpha/beta fold hydrolase [Armatimonadota bacterium]